MDTIFPGRYTADTRDEMVLFIIGMRINRFRSVGSWWPVFRAMPRMLEQLMRHPELGMRHFETFFTWRKVIVIQYWESFEKLERFARDPDLEHVPAWREFNRRVGTNGHVGIFHETYSVRGQDIESIYGNMPVSGLARAFGHLPVAARGQSAAKRIGKREEDDPAEIPPA